MYIVHKLLHNSESNQNEQSSMANFCFFMLLERFKERIRRSDRCRSPATTRKEEETLSSTLNIYINIQSY